MWRCCCRKDGWRPWWCRGPAVFSGCSAGVTDISGTLVWETGEDYYIPWECIKQIGDDIILIDKPVQRRPPYKRQRRRSPF